MPRGLLAVGGASVARHQLALALALDCRRILCLARDFSPGMAVLQQAAEQAGAQFQVISSAQRLATMLSAADELLVFADGLLVAAEGAMPLLGQGAGVLVQPIEAGLPAGFERIDINHASAGILRMPGRLAERLGELPADCDAVSALTRIALQAGVPQRMVPPQAREGAAWTLVRDEDEAHGLEAAWFRLHLGSPGAAAPGPLAARALVRSLGPMLLHAGSGASVVTLGAGVLLLLALLAAWLGHPAPAFVLLGLAWLARRCAALLGTVERQALQRGGAAFPREALFGWLLDGLLVLVAVWAPVAAGEMDGTVSRGFAMTMLLCLLRLAPRGLAAGWGAAMGDRVSLSLLLAVAAAAEALLPFTRGLALGVAIAALAAPHLGKRITRS